MTAFEDIPDSSVWDNYNESVYPEYSTPAYTRDVEYKESTPSLTSPADLSDDCRKIPRTEDEYYR